MKSLLLIVALVLSTGAFAQKHMVEFNADSFLLGKVSFNSSKTREMDSEEDKSGFIFLNYAYTIAPQVQLGVQGSYDKYKWSDGTSEGYAFLVGGIYNFGTELNKAFYTSVYAGWDWSHDWDSFGDNEYEEKFVSKFSVGKRFPLTFLNLENFTYSPEITFESKNSTKRSDREWEQEFSIKYLQFSVLF